MQDTGLMEPYKVEVGRSELHIEKHETGLKVYVPRDQASQDVCYYSKLPTALTTWMMTSRTAQSDNKLDEAAVRIVNIVLNARKSALPRILESEGIMDVDYVIDENDDDVESVTIEGRRSIGNMERTLEDENKEGESEDEAGEQLPTPPSPSVAGRESSLLASSSTDAEEMVPTFARAVFTATASAHEHMSRVTSPRAQQELNIVPSREIPAIQTNVNLEYLRILETTINVARSFVIPSKGPFNMSGLLNALPADFVDLGNFANERIGIRSTSQIERDKRIGAAGELFVRRLFRILDLSPFLC
jgi:hypothetical protein